MRKISFLLLPSFLLAATIPIQEIKELDLTIYNNNIGFVSEYRSVDIPVSGKNTLKYEGVSSSIISESISTKFSKSIILYSQNYRYDSFRSIYEKSIGEEILYKDSDSFKKGVLLSTSPILVKNEKQEIISLKDLTEIKIISIPSELAIKPSLFWNIEGEHGLLDVNLNYLATGISWRSNYIFSKESSGLNIQGWITIKNDSGITFEQANLSCVSGEVNQVQPPMMLKANMMRTNEMFADASGPSVSEESFSGYHLYKIPFKETIRNKEEKQINFLKKINIKYEEYGQGEIPQTYYKFPKRELPISHFYKIENKEDKGLGIPFPAGTIRVFDKDKENKSRFVGEDKIDYIQKNEDILIKTGLLFDVKATEEIISFKDTKFETSISSLLKIKNSGKEDEIIKFKLFIPENGKIEDDCSGICSKHRNFDESIEYIIKSKRDSVYELKISSEIKKHY